MPEAFSDDVWVAPSPASASREVEVIDVGRLTSVVMATLGDSALGYAVRRVLQSTDGTRDSAATSPPMAAFQSHI